MCMHVMCVTAADRGHQYLSRKVKSVPLDEKNPQSPSEGSLTSMSTPADTPAGEFPLALQLPLLAEQAGGDRTVEEELREGGKGTFSHKDDGEGFW